MDQLGDKFYKGYTWNVSQRDDFYYQVVLLRKMGVVMYKPVGVRTYIQEPTEEIIKEWVDYEFRKGGLDE